jgi:hypothetical protein
MKILGFVIQMKSDYEYIPVPAPSSNATTPWNSDEHNALCNIKSANTSSALHT